MKRPPDLILFDLDGALVDSIPAIEQAVAGALDELGLRGLESGEMRALVGPPVDEVWGVLLDRRGIRSDREFVERGIARYREHYSRHYEHGTALVPGIEPVLRTLAMRAELRIATSKSLPAARLIVAAVGLADLFDGVFGANPDARGETKAEVIARALAVAEAGTSVVMVGDRRHDVIGARAHGVATVGVTWGYGTREELVGAEARWIIDEPCQLLDVLHA